MLDELIAQGRVDEALAAYKLLARRQPTDRNVRAGLELCEGLRALAPFGRAVVFGAASGQPARLDAATLDHFFYAPAPNQSLTAFNIGGWFMARPQAAGAALGELVGAVASGAIRPPALHTLPLAQAAQAHRQMEARQTSGKLVLKPWQ